MYEVIAMFAGVGAGLGAALVRSRPARAFLIAMARLAMQPDAHRGGVHGR